MMMFEEPMASYPPSSEAPRFHGMRMEENRDQHIGRSMASSQQAASVSLQSYAADLMAAAAAIQAHRDSSKYLDAEVERAMSAFGPRKDSDAEEWSQEKGEAGLDIYSCDQFRMYEFKVRRCMRGRSHDWTECPFAHPGEKARRWVGSHLLCLNSLLLLAAWRLNYHELVDVNQSTCLGSSRFSLFASDPSSLSKNLIWILGQGLLFKLTSSDAIAVE
jgi:hypothetical protein